MFLSASAARVSARPVLLLPLAQPAYFLISLTQPLHSARPAPTTASPAEPTGSASPVTQPTTLGS